MSQAYLQDTAGVQLCRLEKLEVMYAVAHNGLVSFLTLLDPDFIDTCLKQGQIIQKLDDRLMQQRVILAFDEERERAKQPGYTSTYDDYDQEEAVAEARPSSTSQAAPGQTTQIQQAEKPRGPHKAPAQQPQDADRSQGDFGAGILE